MKQVKKFVFSVSGGKVELLHQVKEIEDMTNMVEIRQKKALGLDCATCCAKSFVGNEPFMVEFAFCRKGLKDMLKYDLERIVKE